MKIEMPPLESCADIGGLDSQIQKIKEAVELPELYEDIGSKPPKGESYCMRNKESSTCKGERADALFCIPLLKGKTPEEIAHADLETHYTKEYLDEKFESCTRRAILYKEYVKNISSSGMQSTCGFEGQINSCWTQQMTTKEQNEEATVHRRMMMFLARKTLKADVFSSSPCVRTARIVCISQ